MEAFPMILEKVPDAKLVVAGANVSTRAGFWEIHSRWPTEELQSSSPGYVAEDNIRRIVPVGVGSGAALRFSDRVRRSATSACEYGVPIVCADIPDFRGMVTDEGMAVRFYKVGNARDLADQIIRILRSSELEHKMAEQNFTAGVQMTMTNVIRSYLRWFRLHQAKSGLGRRYIHRAALSLEQRRSRQKAIAAVGPGRNFLPARRRPSSSSVVSRGGRLFAVDEAEAPTGGDATPS